MPIIDVKNLCKIYNEATIPTEVLRDISFSVNEGEFVAIMGPSGSGKSTLLHIIGFLDPQSSGRCLFNGKSLEDYSEDELAHIRNKEMGFVFQAFNLLPRTSVYENVKLPLIYSEKPEKEWNELIKASIKTVGLDHRESHDPSQLSGGEKQRVAIARALVSEPEVIFADEPTGNLDTKSGEKIMEMFQQLNNKGHTVVLITHDNYIAEYADRIIKIVDGEIRSDKKTKKLCKCKKNKSGKKDCVCKKPKHR